MAAEALRVTVCHAWPQESWQQSLTLPPGATAGQAVEASGFASRFPGIDPWDAGVGIYGRRCRPDTVLQDGDRVEIYRPLDFDPMESRRRRAAHKPLPFGRRRH